MSNTSNQPELLVAQEVATLLRIEIATVYAAAAAGKLPAVRLWRGKRKSLLRFRRSEIEQLISQGDPGTTPRATLPLPPMSHPRARSR